MHLFESAATMYVAWSFIQRVGPCLYASTESAIMVSVTAS
jgi:hypothetical protein